MKILFFGTPKFAEIVLEGIMQKHQIVGVVCQNDKPSGRGNKLKSPDIVTFAKNHNIPVFQFERLKEHIDDFKKIDCDLFVTASYGKILPKSLLDFRPCINVHPSLLPKYRGATPIQTALLNGDEVTGVTIMKTEVGMDDGDIYLQKEVEISPEEDYVSLSGRLAKISVQMLLQVLDEIQNGTAKRTKQDDSKATFVKMIEKADAELDFSQKTRDLVNKVRAFCGDPVAFFWLGDDRIKVYKANVADMSISAPVGSVLSTKKRFLLQASDGVFEVLKCQAPGGKVLDANVFLNGYHFKSDRAVFSQNKGGEK